MSKRLTGGQVVALADDLTRMLSLIETGEMKATAATRHRIEGGLVVLEVVLGRSARLAFDGLASGRP